MSSRLLKRGSRMKAADACTGLIDIDGSLHRTPWARSRLDLVVSLGLAVSRRWVVEFKLGSAGPDLTWVAESKGWVLGFASVAEGERTGRDRGPEQGRTTADRRRYRCGRAHRLRFSDEEEGEDAGWLTCSGRLGCESTRERGERERAANSPAIEAGQRFHRGWSEPKKNKKGKKQGMGVFSRKQEGL